MEDFDFADYILRQQKGTLSETERTALRQWYEASEEHQKQYRDYCVLLASEEINRNRKRYEPTKVERWKQIHRRMHRKKANERRWPTLRTTWKYVAVFVLAFGLGIVCMHKMDAGQEEAMQYVEVPLGAKSHLILPDGSTVWLNAGSRLSYNSGFGTTNRLLHLDGEGCFDVTKNRKLAFEVISGKTKIKVLGTRFNMRAYSEDIETKVTLLEGRLMCHTESATQPTFYLSPNQQAVINRQTQNLKIQNVNATDYSAWIQLKHEALPEQQPAPHEELPTLEIPNNTMRNMLFFDEEPFSQIVRDLGRAFNVHIEIADKQLGNERFYGDFRNGETIYQILDIITSSNNLQYKIKENKITIFKN